MGTKLNRGRFDCLAAAADDEPMFVLLARDRHAPILVQLWAALRELDAEDPDKVAEARQCAAAMQTWAEARGRKVLPLPDGTATALGAALAERIRQVEAEGWTPEHDDGHSDSSLARAAAVYAYVSTLRPDEIKHHRVALYGISRGFTSIVQAMWRWAPHWFKPRGPRRDMVRAAALSLAEIERIDRREAADA